MSEDLTKYKQPFDPYWPYGHLYNGEPCRIIATNVKSSDPIVAVVLDEVSDEEYVIRATSDGDNGLIINKPEPEKRYWVNVYVYFVNTTHLSREEADNAAMKVPYKRLACLEFVEGEGLEE